MFQKKYKQTVASEKRLAVPTAKLQKEKLAYDAMAVSPDVKKQIVIKDLFSSGQTSGKTYVPKDFVVNLYNNTRQFTNKFNYPIPIQEGHDDKDQALKGRLLGMELQSRKSVDDKGKETEEKVIVGKYEIYGDLATKYSQGLLPGLSIGINPDGFSTAKDKTVGEYIDHVALLGKDTPALPQLLTHTHVMAHGQFTFSMKPAMQMEIEKPSTYVAGENSEEEPSMEEVKKNLAEAMALLAACQEMIGKEETAEGDEGYKKDASSANGGTKKDEGAGSNAGAGNATTDMKKEYALLESKLADLKSMLEKQNKANETAGKAAVAFQTLFSQGHVVNDDRAFFDKQVSALGLDEVVAHYEKRPVETPPLGGGQAQSNREPIQTQFQFGKGNVINFHKAGTSTTDIAKMAKMDVKNVEAIIEEYIATGGK